MFYDYNRSLLVSVNRALLHIKLQNFVSTDKPCAKINQVPT